MSTSDAGDLELRLAEGKRATAQHEQLEALKFGTDKLRQEEDAHCGYSEVQIQQPATARFTSFLFLTLNKKQNLNKPELKSKTKPDSYPYSLNEPQNAETEDCSCQVNRQTSPSDNSIETASANPLLETTSFPAEKEDKVISVCYELESASDLSINHSFSNGDSGPQEHITSMHIFSWESQPQGDVSGLVQLGEDIQDHTKLENQQDLEDATVTMLSSTVVTVLAPHWSGRLRRTKRFEGTGNSEAQGNLQDLTNTTANHVDECFQDPQNQHQEDRMLTGESQTPSRVSFLGTRRNTVDWSANSGPASLDYIPKRKMTQAVSLDVNSGRTDSRKKDAGTLSPEAKTASSVSPLSHDLNEQRKISQTGNQQGAVSSKPTTSSLLLSLRRFNSNGRSCNAASTFSDVNPLSLSSTPVDQGGELVTAHTSQTSFNNNEQDRPKPLLSLSSICYRATEAGPVVSPSSSSHRERNTSEKCFFSNSLKDTEDALFIQQPTSVSKTQPSDTCLKHSFLGKLPPERHHTTIDLFSENSGCLPRHSQNNQAALLKTHSPPRRATLASTSWWKKVTQEASSPLSPSDTTDINDKPSTPFGPPCNDYTDLASLSTTDSKMLGSQISNRDNNNTTELVCKGNINLAMKTQEGTHNLRQINAKDSPDHESGRLVKQQFGYNLNNRESQKPHSLPDVLPDVLASSLHQSKDLNKLNQNNSAFTATLPNFKSSNTPTESYSKYSNNYCSSTTSCIPASPHKDAEKLAKQSSSNRATFGLPPISNTKTSSPFSTHSLSNQANIHTLSYVGFSSQTSKFTNSANTIPLGFERSSASILTASDPKTVSTKIPTSSAVSKANYNLISSSPPAATASPVPSFTTITISSFQTPPATPIMTSHNSEIPSYKEGRAFSGRTESGPKKLQVEGKGVRRVTWGDSVDLLHFEPITVEKPDPSGVPASPLSLPRSPVSVRAPSIFSFLRSDSPTKTKSPLCSPTPKNSNIQVGKGGKYRSLSSGSVDLTSKHQEICKQKTSDNKIFDHRTRDLTTTRQERTQSVESGIFQHCPSAPLSLPPDFSGGYKVRYSSTPYSTLMSSRSTQGETKTITLISPLFQQACQSVYNPHPSLQGEPLAGMNLPTSRPPLLPTSPHQPLTLPFQNKTVMQESLSCGVSEIDQINNNQSKNSSQDHQNGQIFLVDNKVHMNSQPLRGDKAHNSFSAYVTETLIYSIKSKVDTAAAATKNNALKSLQHTENTSVSVEKQLHTVQSNAVEGKSHSRSDESCSGSSSTETNSRDEEGCNQRIKECVLSKSSNEQSPKRSRFPLRKSISTQNSSLSRSDSDRTNKTNNKMDQVLNRLRQTFSNRRSDDDLFPWKWKRASQATGSGSNDISSVSDVTVESTKTLEECEEKRGMALKDKETACTERWTQNRCTVIPPPVAGEQFFIGSDKSAPETSKDEQNVCTENESENKTQVHLTGHSPTMYQSDFSKESRTDCKPRNQFLLYRDPSPGRSANPSGDYPTRLRSTSSPRSPFLSLSPLSPFSLPDVTDDSVFYSPKLQHRREFTSPCEPEERICLGASRRNHVSTDPRSAGLGQDKEHLASSYADLKYGIEPGRSVSVSSVLSSRPSGPGRISTGSKFMSVGDLSESSLTCGGTSKNLDQWLFTPDWATDCDSQHADSCSGKMRSRSLPRSLTRRLANWSSGVSISQPVITTASKPACLWSPNMKNCHFAWDTGPPTPPPTPPLSPSSRLMFKCLSSSMVPSSPGAQQPVDSQFSRGHLPSRSYVASLSTFEESSDSSSDTTTDDEYYLETGEDEKETEL